MGKDDDRVVLLEEFSKWLDGEWGLVVVLVCCYYK